MNTQFNGSFSDIDDIKQNLSILKRALIVLKKFKDNDQVILDDFDWFLENSHSIASILTRKGLSEGYYKAPGALQKIPINFFENFMMLYDQHVSFKQEAIFLSLIHI